MHSQLHKRDRPPHMETQRESAGHQSLQFPQATLQYPARVTSGDDNVLRYPGQATEANSGNTPQTAVSRSRTLETWDEHLLRLEKMDSPSQSDGSPSLSSSADRFLDDVKSMDIDMLSDDWHEGQVASEGEGGEPEGSSGTASRSSTTEEERITHRHASDELNGESSSEDAAEVDEEMSGPRQDRAGAMPCTGPASAGDSKNIPLAFPSIHQNRNQDAVAFPKDFSDGWSISEVPMTEGNGRVVLPSGAIYYPERDPRRQAPKRGAGGEPSQPGERCKTHRARSSREGYTSVTPEETARRFTKHFAVLNALRKRRDALDEELDVLRKLASMPENLASAGSANVATAVELIVKKRCRAHEDFKKELKRIVPFFSAVDQLKRDNRELKRKVAKMEEVLAKIASTI